jgi:hypothetical protein
MSTTNAQRIRFNVKHLLVWMSLFAILLSILTSARYANNSILVSCSFLTFFLIAHVRFRSRKGRSLNSYVIAYSLFLAMSIAIALCTELILPRTPKHLGFFAAMAALGEALKLVSLSFLFVGLFLLISVVGLAIAYWRKRQIRRRELAFPTVREIGNCAIPVD